MDEEDRAFRAHLGQTHLQAGEIIGHLRTHIGIGAYGVEALELAHLRRDFRGNGDRHRNLARDDIAGATFMIRVHVGVDETNGHRAETARCNGVGNGLQRLFVEGQQFLPLRADAPFDCKAILTRDQRLRQAQIEIILLEAAFGAHLDDIAKTVCRHKGRARAAPFDQSIGGKRGAMNDNVEIGGANARIAGHNGNAVEDRLFGRAVIGQNLRGIERAFAFERDVGEGAADISAKADGLAHTGSFLERIPKSAKRLSETMRVKISS